MTVITKEALIQRAEEVKNEVVKGANTANRVGGLLEDMIEYLTVSDLADLAEATGVESTDLIKVSRAGANGKLAISALTAILEINKTAPIHLVNGEAIPEGKDPHTVYIIIDESLTEETTVVAPTGYYLKSVVLSIPHTSSISSLVYSSAFFGTQTPIDVVVDTNMHIEYPSVLVESHPTDKLTATDIDVNGYACVLEYKKFLL